MKRKSIHSFVTDEAHEAWNEFSATHGVTVSAAIEVLATVLHGIFGEDFDPGQELLREARQIDADRRRRRKR